MKFKAGDRVQLVRKISDLPGSWIGRYGTVTGTDRIYESVYVEFDKIGREKKIRKVFAREGNFILIKPKKEK